MAASSISTEWTDLVQDCLSVIKTADRSRRAWAIGALYRLGELAAIEQLTEEAGFGRPYYCSSQLAFQEFFASRPIEEFPLDSWSAIVSEAIWLLEYDSECRSWGVAVLERLGRLADWWLDQESPDLHEEVPEASSSLALLQAKGDYSGSDY